MGPLAQIFSTAEGVKRKLVDALRNPGDAAAQFIGNQSDRARNLQGMTQAATDEFVSTGSLRGPQQSRLDQMIAEAYNPIGMVGVTGPRSEALETARRNAVKMLGLPENNTAMDRAKALGFDVDGFHGMPTPMRGSGFDPAMVAKNDYGAIGQGVYIDPSANASYANSINMLLGNQSGSNILPVKVRSGNMMDAADLPAIYSAERSQAVTQGLKNQGIDSVMSSVQGVPNEMMVIDPSRIRSRFAAFDPARVNENDLLGRASLPFLGLLGIGAGGAAYINKDSQQP